MAWYGLSCRWLTCISSGHLTWQPGKGDCSTVQRPKGRKSRHIFGLVLFRTSAYSGAKQASRVPTGSKQVNSPHNDDVKDVSVLLEGHSWGFISRKYAVWPTFLLMNVFIDLKGSHFWFLFDFTAAGVVPCGGCKTSPCISTIVQFIFYFGPLRSAIIFWKIRNKWLV